MVPRHVVRMSTAFFVGTRRQQTILARLRLSTCNLNFSRSRLDASVDEECECGGRETIRHFCLSAPVLNVLDLNLRIALSTLVCYWPLVKRVMATEVLHTSLQPI